MDNTVTAVQQGVQQAETRAAWYRARAEWHGKMAVYCVQVARKDDTGEMGAAGFIRDAYTHARSAGTYELLYQMQLDTLAGLQHFEQIENGREL